LQLSSCPRFLPHLPLAPSLRRASWQMGSRQS
jgi:hypothetical protein